MNIEGENFTFVNTFETPITVADSWVMPKNKLGGGNGEAKLYVGSRDKMESFFGEIYCNLFCFASGLASLYERYQVRIFHSVARL